MNPEIRRHLNEAFKHLQEALQISIQSILADRNMQKPIGEAWEQFLGNFFQMIRIKGRENKLNLLSLISFSKIWRL